MEIFVTTREGRQIALKIDEGCGLMTTLRDADVGIAGTCGGAASCGTCHVTIDAAWAYLLPAPGEDEADMLEALAEASPLPPHSRLSCQIVASAALNGLRLTIPEE